MGLMDQEARAGLGLWGQLVLLVPWVLGVLEVRLVQLVLAGLALLEVLKVLGCHWVQEVPKAPVDLDYQVIHLFRVNQGSLVCLGDRRGRVARCCLCQYSLLLQRPQTSQ